MPGAKIFTGTAGSFTSCPNSSWKVWGYAGEAEGSAAGEGTLSDDGDAVTSGEEAATDEPAGSELLLELQAVSKTATSSAPSAESRPILPSRADKLR
ncbi:hypothetical protein [Cohnella sp.]|uniref:hypothetical protein n=1 Tax=Cohnella sp. TaxID=1883426 RepID=UPI003704CEBB